MKSTSLPKTWIFFFIVVVILVVAAYWQSNKPVSVKNVIPQTPGAQTFLPQSREENAQSMLNSGGNAIFISDQKPGQASLVVDYAVMSAPGFVVVKTEDRGVPGSVVGVSSRISSGRVEKIEVPLTKSLQPDRVYFAELVQDDGDGVFDETKDVVVNDLTESVVLMSFQTSTAQ